MALHLTGHRGGFGPGYTAITRHDEADDSTGISFGVLKLAKGEVRAETPELETAWLIMAGRLRVRVGNEDAALARASLFDDGPSCVHVAAGEPVELTALGDCELTRYATPNEARFAPCVYLPADVADEHRGLGQVGGACLRLVRTIFDGTIADPKARLVLGEVVALPGRWSSYPPHRHRQPEIYHYRFDRPQGYGHAELGDKVLMVRNFDSVKIFHPADHAQCAAPGYGMYYAWVIRHLPGDPYTGPEFAVEHRWTMEPGAQVWHPRGVGDGS